MAENKKYDVTKIYEVVVTFKGVAAASPRAAYGACPLVDLKPKLEVFSNRGSGPNIHPYRGKLTCKNNYSSTFTCAQVFAEDQEDGGPLHEEWG